MAQNFQVDTSDYMGFKYEEYLNQLMSLAMSKPSEYYKIRSDTLKALKQGIITQIYTTYYTLLTTGKVGNASPLGADLVPCYPQQKASQFSLAASKTINEILNSALDIILPANHLDVAKMKLSEKSSGSRIE